jgi:hypothetical protein
MIVETMTCNLPVYGLYAAILGILVSWEHFVTVVMGIRSMKSSGKSCTNFIFVVFETVQLMECGENCALKEIKKNRIKSHPKQD